MSNSVTILNSKHVNKKDSAVVRHPESRSKGAKALDKQNSSTGLSGITASIEPVDGHVYRSALMFEAYSSMPESWKKRLHRWELDRADEGYALDGPASRVAHSDAWPGWVHAIDCLTEAQVARCRSRVVSVHSE